ncbi:unnamed protein product [Miscanthus lutarioriparius]|uniref:Plant heme peroxidase family profile domain-containing protein n=1 Tax=Miscanthus lutarioriparius TaxID=422564 RepID=A0A811N6K8_9POAL|nr:unnamed protein product [Miscanthus lutarioriparius]
MESASRLSLLVVAILGLATAATAQLSSTFYDTSCPKALATIKSTVTAAVNNEARMGASLLRLHFHDCFVDPSLETLALAWIFEKLQSHVLGGPSWTVLLGRRDSTASKDNAERDLPAPSFDLANLTPSHLQTRTSASLTWLLSRGAHDRAGAVPLLPRPHLQRHQHQLHFRGVAAGQLPPGQRQRSPTAFDNAYFSNLLSQKGLLQPDQQLFNGGGTDAAVRSFASSASAFSSAFATAMVNMGNIAPKTGSQGQIRVTCSKINS